MDGEPNGRIKCTLANWTGVAYKIPRTELEKCGGRDDLSQSGVYFLFGSSDDTERNVVYIGQAGVRKNGEGILKRLGEHKRNSEKDYWSESVVFTTSNNSFGPTEISYLENRFTNMALSANRYLVKNSNDPSPGNITEEKECELEEFIDYAKIIMGVLGHNVFEPLLKQPASHSDASSLGDSEELLLHFKRKSRKSDTTIEADCKRTNEGFVVLKGSMVEIQDSDSIPPGIKAKRLNANISADGILQEDIFFKSPSGAAAFVIGMNTNGLVDWKISDGRTLKDLESSEVSGV
jgi:hypothetical protein